MRRARHTRLFVWILTLAISHLGPTACGGDGPDESTIAPRPVDRAGPVVARVGETDLLRSDVAPLAALARSLRRELELPVPEVAGFAQDLDLAVELVALATAGAELPDSRAASEEGRERLLARIYLDRIFEQVQDQPISDEDLQRAHRQEIAHYRATLESTLYRPTRVDAMAIAVGRFPSLKTYSEAGIPDVLGEAAAKALAAQVRDACGDRVADLDAFLAIGRRFSSGHPTLRLTEFKQVNIGAREAALPAGVLDALVGLDGNGAVSQVVWSGNAAYVLRRGVTYPGRGERWQDVRDALRKLVMQNRARARFERVMDGLKERISIHTFPERIEELERRLARRPAP